MAKTPQVSSLLDVNPELQWDEEARANAWEEAKALFKRDPEAGEALIAQLEALNSFSNPSNEPYDPPRIYARMAKFYGWSHDQMDNMHFPTFFAYVREASIICDEEKEAMDEAKNNRGMSDAEIGNSEQMIRSMHW